MAVCIIDPVSGQVTYRSSKHNSSAFSHRRIYLGFFLVGRCKRKLYFHLSSYFRLKDVQPELFHDKNVLVKGVDGGPDENPRFYNNMNMGIKSFQDQ